MDDSANDQRVRTDAELKRSALLVASVSSFLVPFLISAINVAIERIGDEFSLDAVMQSWVNSAYLLSATIFLIPFGRAADIYGRKKIFVTGMAVISLTSLLSAVSNTTALFLMMRGLQGVGGAMILGTGVAILTSVFPLRERGRALGINVASVYLGLSLGPFIGGMLTDNLCWRSIFLASAAVGSALTLFAIVKLKGEWSGAPGEGFDYAGSIIYSLSLIALMLGFSFMPAPAGFILVAASVAGISAFVVIERRISNPVLDVNLFIRNPVFAFSNLAALINYSATFAVTFLLSLYLQNVKGLNPEEAGFVLVAQPIVMALFSPLAGRFSDTVEPRIVATSGMVITTSGLTLLVFLGKEASTGYIVASLVILGFGFALFSSPNVNAIMSSVDKRQLGVAASTVGTMRMIGQMLSMGIALMVLAIYIGSDRISTENLEAFVASMQVAFIIFTCLCFAGIFASLARGRLHQ